mmetsp:Transcript_17319/g.49245  ORF Transcript_17319/g.49245 Transcript_17319/m.49245 type:complete len:482 (+) Transcript_17319:56-1501(+)|eukprot:CAMPEP_0179247172 /NCGR_PEP_ID=MMETSP0797-20121207/19471_1 /TAXON_ID=47934 /ORGANISM="Dinophysis acuminata, Strain DAEP01" /LENGTH=481 /DNA_ID=CAMNT_0020954781 /DNA_START=52 /DNA_END=1497 /DNA_ORIENTATION=+
MPFVSGLPADNFDNFMGDDLQIFGVEPEFQEKLRWMDAFVREEVEPLDMLGFSPYDTKHPLRASLYPPLQQQVRDKGLWACHLGPELGGPGYGQMKLALMNMILGRSGHASKVFGTAAPDTGNSEILAHFGTPEQKSRYLEPLLADKISSCWSMTEPKGGADPTGFITRAVQDSATGEWVIDGEKIWSSNGKYASFYLVSAVTEASVDSPHSRMSIFIVDAENPGLRIIKNLGVGGGSPGNGKAPKGMNGGSHAHVEYKNCRVPADALLGERGGGFLIQQTRLSGGRIHYGMRAVGQCKKALDMCLVRVNSRWTKGESLAAKQLVQNMLAEAWMELEQLKLIVLRTAYKIDKYNDYRKVRLDISACKVLCSTVQASIARKAIQIHGGIGASWDLPLADMLISGLTLGIADGPSEVHVQVVAKQLLRGYSGTRETHGDFPEYGRDNLKRESFEKFAPVLRRAGIDLAMFENEGGVYLHWSKL